MGNRLSLLEFEDIEDPSVDIELKVFRSLKLKWTKMFFSRIAENMLSDFDINNEREMVSWKDFFRIFSDIKLQRDIDIDQKRRMMWHPAAMGFMMNRDDSIQEIIAIEAKKENLPPDEWTDDDESDFDESDEDEEEEEAVEEGAEGEGGAGHPSNHHKQRPKSSYSRQSGASGSAASSVVEIRKKAVNPKLDSEIINPIFFGYSTDSVQEFERKKKAEAASLKIAEERAVKRTKEARGNVLDGFESSMKSQANVRLKKMKKLEQKYEAAKVLKEKDLVVNKGELPPAAYRMFQLQWEKEFDAAEKAFEEELGRMRQNHEEQCVSDLEVLQKRREELEAFKDAETQESPSADRLEEIARVEISRWIDELDRKRMALDNARDEYIELRNHLEELVAQGGTKLTEISEVRSMLNITETELKIKQKDVEDTLSGLLDAEVLLNRAVRIRGQQNELLPLFARLSMESTGSTQIRVDLLACAMVALTEATFDQKCAFYFNMFDSGGDGFYSGKFLVRIVLLFGEMYYRLRLFSFPPNEEDIRNMVLRGFMDLGLSFHRDSVTLPEAKRLISTLVSNSFPLANSLSTTLGFQNVRAAVGAHGFIGSPGGQQMGTYQRNRMAPVALLLKGMIGPTTCKHRIHLDLIRPRPQLETRNKALLHERSMAMGENDPYKADYTRFITKPAKKTRSLIQPLNHGHLMCLTYQVDKQRTEAAIKIQSSIRSYLERKLAELAAKKQAYVEASEAAVKEMKEKVVKEFKKRESGTGVGKMKWDAQVRMRQAKLRASGQAVSRSDTVMIMLEEAIDKAKTDILEKFARIEEKEDFSKVDAVKKERIIEILHIDPDVRKLFDLNVRSAVQDLILTDKEKGDGDDDQDKDDDDSLNSGGDKTDDENDDQNTANKQNEKDSANKDDGGEGEGGFDEMAIEEKVAVYDPKMDSFTDLQKKRFKLAVHGKYWFNRQHLGETVFENELRLYMACPEPKKEVHLMNRLRAAHGVITLWKAAGILAENPSKRLLMRYIEGRPSTESLTHDLTTHFSFSKGLKDIADILRGIVSSDLERGLLLLDIKRLEKRLECGLTEWAVKQVEAGVFALSDLVDRKLATNDDVTEAELIEQDLTRARTFVKKFGAQLWEILGNVDTLREQARRVLMSYQEVERKLKIAEQLRAKRLGGWAPDIEVTVADRQSWMNRMKTATGLPESNFDESEKKFEEIRSVCREFLNIATADAVIIISEIFQPKFRKTIPVVAELSVHGRTGFTGRGHDGSTKTDDGGNAGKYYIYEFHNIVYQVCEDYHGIFNGSDEYAMKAGGNERVGSLEYAKTHVPRLQIPLIATIDYFGFRVIAMAKPPTEKVAYTDEGEVRKVSEDLVHGVQRMGDNFINKSQPARALMKLAGMKLNLAEHTCRGMKDLGTSITFCSAEIKIFNGGGDLDREDEFYARDFWRSFPPEIPEETPHLQRTPRDQSVFWRLLRPEFCRAYDESLSPDAVCMLAVKTPDADMHYERLTKATRYLVNEAVPALADSLVTRDYSLPVSEGLGLDLSMEMHNRGINIRHLGLVRSLLWRPVPGTVKLFFHEMIIRTSRDLRDEVRDGERVKIEGLDNEILTVKESTYMKISQDRLPITIRFKGKSLAGVTATVGATVSDKNCPELRCVLLAEMVARAVKSIVRLQLRTFSRKTKAVSAHFKVGLMVEYFNIITGATERANELLQEIIYGAVRERFGALAIRPSEKAEFQQMLEPCTVFIVKRLQSMLGLQLSVACLGEFHERPIGFAFSPLDFLQVAPLVRHSMPMLPFADAMTALLAAQRAERESYVYQVLSDGPHVFLRLNERTGARIADNIGILGKDFKAFYTRGVTLEKRPGPEATDHFCRSAGFQQGLICSVDSKLNTDMALRDWRSHFSVEVFAKCTGGQDTLRTVMQSGRYGIFVGRENFWTFQYHEGKHEVTVRMGPVVYNEWTSLIATYDGVTLRLYVDSRNTVTLEVSGPINLRQEKSLKDLTNNQEELKKAEDLELISLRNENKATADKFFQSKEGLRAMKKASQTLFDSEDFHKRDFGIVVKDNKDELTLLKVKKVESLKLAKEQYISDLFDRTSRDIRERYSQLQKELVENSIKEDEEGEMRLNKPFKIGATLAVNDIKNNFMGDIAMVSFYTSCLNTDRVRTHFLAARSGKTKEAQRMYALTSSKYEEALYFAYDDPMILRGFAQSLCGYLKVEVSPVTREGVSGAMIKISESIEKFRARNVPEGIAEILMALPRDPEYAELISQGFLAIKQADPVFFSRDVSMKREDLVHLPDIYGLNHHRSPKHFLETAGAMFQEVAKDVSLHHVYGDVDLGWISQLKSPELVISLVKHAKEDGNLKTVSFGEIFKLSGRMDHNSNITDSDVEVIGSNMRLTNGFDFAGCSLLTNDAIPALSEVKLIRVLNFDGCDLIDDHGLKYILPFCEALEVLSLAGVNKITDEGLTPIFSECRRLQVVSVSNCPFVTHESLDVLTKNNRLLKSLGAAATQITDEGMNIIACNMSKKNMTSIDVSFCREITDSGINTLAECCPNLKYINICGLTRVSDQGTRSLTNRCWFLETVIFEDVFLVDDAAFWFSNEFDGRQAANDNMLTQLTTLNIRDCVNLTDHAVRGLSERCRAIENLVMRGCDKVTDDGLRLMFDPFIYQFGMCETFKSIDFSFCQSITAKGLLDLLPHCPNLESLNISGVAAVDDGFILQMCKNCPTLIRVHLQRCIQLTDAALCAISDYLWLEELDLSGCYRVSDDGVEVLTSVCTGVFQLHLRRCSKVTSRGVNSIGRYVKNLHHLDVRDCQHVDEAAVQLLMHQQPSARVLF